MRSLCKQRVNVLLRGVAALSLALATSVPLASCSSIASGGPVSYTTQITKASAKAKSNSTKKKESDFDNWTSSSSKKPVDWKWSVKKVDSFKGSKNDVKSSSNGVPFDATKTHIYATDGSFVMNGKELDGEHCYASYGDEVMYFVTAAGKDPNRCGLVTATGQVLIDCDAAALGGGPNAHGQMRYITVAYAGEKASTASDTTIEVDGTNYEMTSKIYDLKKHAFVKGVEPTSNDATLDNLGDTFAITEGNKITLYDEKGKALWSDESSYPHAASDCIEFAPDGRECIVDTSGNVTFTAGDGDILSDIRSEHGVYQNFPKSSYWAYMKKGEKGYAIIDNHGNQVVKGTYDIAYSEADGLFAVKTLDGDEVVVDMNGDVVYSGTSSVHRSVPGYTTSSEGTYHGTKKVSDSTLGHLVVKDDDDYLVLSTGKKLTLDNSEGLNIALVKGKGDGDAYYGVWDLFTGKQIVDSEYEEIQAAGVGSYVDGTCYLYAYKQGTWTVFEAKRVLA